MQTGNGRPFGRIRECPDVFSGETELLLVVCDGLTRSKAVDTRWDW